MKTFYLFFFLLPDAVIFFLRKGDVVIRYMACTVIYSRICFFGGGGCDTL